jgi:prephenate dehydrogenase
MAGSEKTGVAYARADLFDRALCLVTPTDKTSPKAVRRIRSFWEILGARTSTITPNRHDELLARVSHLPHAVATALVNLSSRNEAIDVAGPGFADTTRIASGDPDLWTDIFQTNRRAMVKSVDQLIQELTRFRDRLDREDLEAIRRWLASGKEKRDDWIEKRYRKKVLPP